MLRQSCMSAQHFGLKMKGIVKYVSSVFSSIYQCCHKRSKSVRLSLFDDVGSCHRKVYSQSMKLQMIKSFIKLDISVIKNQLIDRMFIGQHTCR